jgi:hypothetical protein
VLLAGLEQQQHSLIMQLWHDTAHIKADAVAQYVSDLLLEMSDPDDKFLVFAYHRWDLLAGASDCWVKRLTCRADMQG